jgi:hypothetical protein
MAESNIDVVEQETLIPFQDNKRQEKSSYSDAISVINETGQNTTSENISSVMQETCLNENIIKVKGRVIPRNLYYDMPTSSRYADLLDNSLSNQKIADMVSSLSSLHISGDGQRGMPMDRRTRYHFSSRLGTLQHLKNNCMSVSKRTRYQRLLNSSSNLEDSAIPKCATVRGAPLVTLLVQGFLVQVLINIECEVTCVSQSLLDMISAANAEINIVPFYRERIVCTNGNKKTVLRKRVLLSVGFGDIMVDTIAFVVPDLIKGLVLGSNLLSLLDAKINSVTNKLTIVYKGQKIELGLDKDWMN